MLEESQTENMAQPEEKEEPVPQLSLAQKAKNFIQAATAHAMDGLKITSEKERNKRFSICEACEHFDELKTTCNKCGCYLVKKTSWRTSSCPIGKWGPEEIKTDGGIILADLDLPQKKCGGCGKKS